MKENLKEDTGIFASKFNFFQYHLKFSCKYCDYVIVFTSKSGYTNAVSHLDNKHKAVYLDDVMKAVDKLKVSKTASLDQFFTRTVSERAIEYYSWLEWIIFQKLPYSFCEKALTRKYTKLKSISTKTLKKYIFLVVDEVTSILKKTLPDYFTLMFDGWTCDGTGVHYVAVYAIWSDPGTGSVKRFLLACSPLLNEEDYSAASHIEYLESTLAWFDKTMDNVEAISGDNCSTNKLIATTLKIPLIGCASHRLNLAAQIVFEEFEVEIKKVNELMVELRTLKNRAKLRKHTNLQPEIKNQTQAY